MLIKELPLELQELAITNQIAQKNKPDINKNLEDGQTIGNFNWCESIEGGDFWADLYHGKDITNYICYPNKKTIIYNYSIF